MTSILDSSDPQEGREKKKRKEADMESEEDEEEWERRDAQKQAQKKAKLLPARQVSNPFFSFGSSHHGQTPEKTELWSARQNLGNNQKPLVFTNSTASFPGATGSTSSSGTFASNSNTPAPLSVEVDHLFVLSSFGAKKSIDAFPFQAAQTSAMFSQYRSEVSDSPSSDHRSCGSSNLAQAMQDHLESRSSGSLEEQEP
jgi:hypothetical protein